MTSEFNQRITGSFHLDDPVSSLKYVSGAREKALLKLGISTVRDLVYNAPLRYMDFSDIEPIAQCIVGQKATVMGRIDKISMRVVRRRMRIVEASLVDDSGVMNIVWFNQPWITNSIKEGMTVIAQGTVDHRYGFKQMSSPNHLVVDDEGGAKLQIIPVYRQAKGITSAWISRIVGIALDELESPVDPIPVRLRIKRGVMSRQSSIEALHNPASMQQLSQAKHRLAYEELLTLQLHWLMQKETASKSSVAHVHVVDGQYLHAFLDALPFKLSQDQSKALSSILSDMSSNNVMNRMLLGDVGTGKTVVAAGAFASVADTGTQGVMMAPTEVLARQYEEKIGPVFDSIGIRWATLTSATSQADRKNILLGLASGQITVLFSTHAAIEDDVVFQNLSLVVIDEQHRFGVAQREKLKSKGTSCDYLCMTATPIPRSLALTIYGNLDCSYIKQRPGGNREIKTVVMDKRNRFAAFDEIRKEVSKGRQAYIICPLIGEPSGSTRASQTSGNSGAAEPKGSSGSSSKVPSARSKKNSSSSFNSDDVEDVSPDGFEGQFEHPLEEEDFEAIGEDLRAARKEADYLQREVFKDMKVGLLCGQLPQNEKASVMESFRDGDIDVLVSTTVVEVGVDVPNATVMVIEDAERFGLSQLHQLRGRVGRGEHPGEVILLASTKTEVSAKRMQYIASTQDGFELAELDLSLRHEGDVIGSRQHGLSGLRFSNLVRDSNLIEQAREDAAGILKTDPLLKLPVNAILRYEVNAIYSQDEQKHDKE